MGYTLQFSHVFAKQLAELQVPVRRRVTERVRALAENPRPAGAVKLKGSKDDWRLRVGDYRVVYSIEDKQLIIYLLRVGHRRDVYRRFE